MPSSGSFTATYGGHPFTLQLNWSVASQDVTLNQSTISWALYTIKTTANTPFRSDGAATWAFNYAGSGNWGPYNFNGAVGQTILMASGSFVVTHASDGTYTFTPSFSANALSTITTASGSGSAALPTIPRATQPAVTPTSGNTGSTYAIDTSSAASSAFYHDIYYSLDGGSTYTSIVANQPATTTSTNWTPASTLLPNAASATAIIRVDTRSSSGGTIIGTASVNLPLTVPSTVVPTISAVSFVDTQVAAPNMPSLMGGAGRFVQGWSKLQPTISSAGASGSTITASSVTMNGQTAASGVAFGAAVALSGSVPYTANATDSRNRSAVAFNGTCTVKAYGFPNLPTPTIVRTSDAAGLIPSPSGTYLAITPAASVSDLTFSGTQYNTLEYQIRTKPNGGSWTTITAWTAATGVTWTTKQILAGYSSATEYQVEVSIRDVFGHNGYNTGNTVQVLTVTVPSAVVFMDWDEGIGIGFQKYRQNGVIDVHGDIYADGVIYQGAANPVVDTSYVATTAAAGIAKLSTDAQAIAGTDTATAVTPHALAAALAPQIASVRGRKDLIINGSFRINQRVYASAASLALNSYGFDRWKASTASTTCTFTAAPQGQQITLNSGGSIMQVIERANVLAGTYTLSWTGTATARVYNSGSSAPAYASSPVTVTLDGLQNVNVEFAAVGSTKTVGQVQLEAGTVATAYEVLTYGEELAQCQRYFWQVLANNASDQTRFANGWQTNTTTAEAGLYVPVPMRTTPTIAFANVGWGDGASIHSTITALTLYQTPWSATNTLFQLSAVFSAAGAQFRPGTISAFAAVNAFISLSAEF